ncbi:MAG: SGNH/GDSL hydrolase family protein [Clostridia bacterium]|nr:SGNH/GDSL hydrolase family protein [Clostridia bacterium]
MELNGIKINVLGDSITEGVGATCRETGFVGVLARKTGAIVNNYGISGTRIARQKRDIPAPHFNTPFIDRVDDMAKDADVVIVFGGTNDFGHGDAAFGEYMSEDEWTFCGAFNQLLKKLFVAFPNAEIVVMTPLHRASENVTTNEIGLPCHPLRDYVEMEKKYCEHYSVPVLDLWSVSGIQPCNEVLRERFAPDALHPNDRGHERIADRIIGFLKTLK